MTSSHEDADSRFFALKKQVQSLAPFSRYNPLRFCYVSGDPDRPAERYYGFQYAMAPYLISNDEPGARYLCLDFETPEALSVYCRGKPLEMIFQSGGLALARRTR